MAEALAKQGKKLPLYGPLDIQNYKAFLEESKEKFIGRHNTVFHSDISIQGFEALATLGRGSFGSVKLVREKDSDNYYAVKVQLKQKIKQNESSHRVYLEKQVLFGMDFPFCVRIEHYCHDKDAIYFLMPFVRGGELYNLIKKFGRFQSSMTRFYAAQVVLALEFFQYIHFVYRDLKPENILVDHTGFLKITDYGLAKEVSSRTYTICGTPAYMAPEVVEGSGYARSADWWSLGILIFEMAYGKPPYIAKDSVELFTMILYAPVPMRSVFSSQLKSLLRGLLQKDVTFRLGNLKNGAEDVKKHPWFKNIDWLQLLNRRVQPPYVPETSGPADTSNFPFAAKVAASSHNIKTIQANTIRQELFGEKTKTKRKTRFCGKSLNDSLFQASV
ncbi:cAMP-dependent protein kinase catalytic subunit beta-like [Macrosteles quadrilineatus]|uniref:cAMP-dependent protein kinase catalytic subunit beta-like n=1 Tax=Macrosteles quadrilineatus TaxID=74068 RepID=UPI0023E13110|nr:cAMP-dependent protein kinase catalytic subunit beta-like [Macrosteles quadrilineatus]